MEGESKRSDLRSLVEAIKASDDVETRVSLISQIGDSYQSETSDVVFLVQHLIVLWVEPACLDISQCILNKKILNVVAQCVESVESNCFTQFLILGTKASSGCRKYLQMAVESYGELVEEQHSIIFFQIILDSLNFSSASIAKLTRSPVIGKEVDMHIIEDFILEQLNLTKSSILEIQRFHSIASEVLKMVQVILDALIKLCRAYAQASDLDSCKLNKRNVDYVNLTGIDYARHVISITASTIENLYELGTFAASGGGSLVTILNLSWKGVVSLLQLTKGIHVERLNVGDIILSLVSLATESLRCATESWSSFPRETVPISDAKRAFLPIKFFLINAVRISSDYPREAIGIFKEITQCVLSISTLSILWGNEMHLRSVSEGLVELVEPTALLLLHTLLNSADVNSDVRCQILDWLFTAPINSDLMHLDKGFGPDSKSISLDGIFTMSCDATPTSDMLLLGRVVVFLNLLKTSQALKEDMVVSISCKLDCLLDILMHEDIYASILGLEIPISCGSSSPGVVWQTMFSFTLHTLRTFMLVATSSHLAWTQVETFLLCNFLHLHFLCQELVMELWCFLIRHAELDMVHHMVDGLFSILKIIASSESSLAPFCPLRKMARSICILLTHAKPTTIDQVFNSILSDNDSYLSSIISMTLILEGFPLLSLSDNVKIIANQKVQSEFCGFLQNYFKEHETKDCISGLHGLPVYALSSALLSCQIKESSIIDEKLASQIQRFAISLLHSYKQATDSTKENYAKLLSAVLDIISKMKHVYARNDIGELILELKTLFVSCSSTDSNAFLYQVKPSLSSFMAKLCHMELAEGEDSTLCSAIYDLYHVLLRDRHWAFIHLAIAAFGYFAARTSWTELWRFVPQDAALSFDVNTGHEANEDRFMSELKAYLEKEVAFSAVILCKEQLSCLAKEGMILKKNFKIDSIIPQVIRSEKVEAINANEDHVKVKRRKLPNGIDEGMELLQNGLKVMSNAIAQTESSELKDAFSSHISRLEDVISHMIDLTSKS
ncbi:Deoxyguanosinetriphosphate triphosphohydrolase C-terminal protein [Dioscorea alata]|uniref:Deoxyguanosinetriphosphate triphosphohydrolase C-terminal protein n=1 Tax=Dioscorea alata TaxID=55571 RepID=A0ACB7WRP4_DIOAL|nr:Deoxyguanosinetriphosphate triphosphohydrolase C-terminal protein [Dioscorea alata]